MSVSEVTPQVNTPTWPRSHPRTSPAVPYRTGESTPDAGSSCRLAHTARPPRPPTTSPHASTPSRAPHRPPDLALRRLEPSATGAVSGAMGARAPTSDPRRRPCSVLERCSSCRRRLIGPRRLARHLCASADTTSETQRRRDVRTRDACRRERRRRRLASSRAQRRRAGRRNARIIFPFLFF